MSVDQGWDDGLSGQVDRGGPGGGGDLSGGSDLEDSVAFYEEGSVFDHVSVTEDQAGAFEEEGGGSSFRWGPGV